MVLFFCFVASQARCWIISTSTDITLWKLLRIKMLHELGINNKLLLFVNAMRNMWGVGLGWCVTETSGFYQYIIGICSALSLLSETLKLMNPNAESPDLTNPPVCHPAVLPLSEPHQVPPGRHRWQVHSCANSRFSSDCPADCLCLTVSPPPSTWERPSK